MVKKILGVLLTASLAFFATTVMAKPLKVVATTGMIGDLVQNIGGDQVQLETLMGAGVDPHLYKATQGDLRRLQRADVIFYNGLHLEGKMQDIFDKLARKKPVYAVTEHFDENVLLYRDGAHDPHVWFDVQLWHQAGEEVLAKLSQNAPEHKALFEKNAATYLAKLTVLDAWVQQQIDTIPQQQRVLITAHDAFGYFGKAYGVEVQGLQGISTASEFGLNDIKQLKDVILQRHIKAVFVESSVPKKFLKSLVAGVTADGHQLKIGGELFSDAMGLSGTREGTYIGMVEHNVNTIVGALK